MIKKFLYILVFLCAALVSAKGIPTNIAEQYNYLKVRNDRLENTSHSDKTPWYIILKDGDLSDLKQLLKAVDADYGHLTIKSEILAISESGAKQINDYLTQINAKSALGLYVALEDSEPMVVPISMSIGSHNEDAFQTYYKQYLDSVTVEGYDPETIKQQISKFFKHDNSLLTTYAGKLSQGKPYQILMVESLAMLKSKTQDWAIVKNTSYKNYGEKEIGATALQAALDSITHTYSTNSSINWLYKYSAAFYSVVYDETPDFGGSTSDYDFDVKNIALEETIEKHDPNDEELLPKKGVRIYDFAGLFTADEYAEINQQLEALPINHYTNVFVYYTDTTVSPEIIEQIEDTPNKSNTVALWLHLEGDGTISSKLLMSQQLEQHYAFLKVWRQKSTFEKIQYRGEDALRDFGTGFAEFGAILGEFVRKAEIPEYVYNRCHPNFETEFGGRVYQMVQKLYAYTDDNSVLERYTINVYRPFVKKLMETGNINFCNFDINKDADVLWVVLAYSSGVYNGLINLIAEVPESFVIVNFLINPDINQTEEVKKFFDAITVEKVWSLATTSLGKAFPKDNMYVMAHSSGKATVFIASLAVAYTKVGKISKISKALEGLDALSVMFKAIGIGNKYTLKVMGQASSGIYKLVKKAGGETLMRLIKATDTPGYKLAIAINGVRHELGKIDEEGVIKISDELDDGEVLETLEDVSYLDDGVKKTGDLTVVRNGEEVGVDLVDGVSELIAQIKTKFPKEWMNVWDDFVADFGDNTELLKLFKEKPELVRAWKKLSHLPRAVRTNLTNLLQRNLLDEYAEGIATASNARKGNFGEIGADLDLNIKGYNSLIERIDNIDVPGHNGIDGVFEKNGQYYIVEGKYTGSASLNPANPKTGLPRQMSDDWIRQRLNDAVGEDLADEILDNGYIRLLAKVSPDGTVNYRYVSETGYLTKGGGPLGEFNP